MTMATTHRDHSHDNPDENDMEQPFVLITDPKGEGVNDDDLVFSCKTTIDTSSTRDVRRDGLATVLRRELTWTLSSPILELIQEFVLPLSDLEDRYLDVVERFRSIRVGKAKATDLGSL
ncbi:hypothetical protein BGZ83_010357 [Gryganskiella cystojenkinii]|nr:hypothetical protein BGZ83_010357 [Gryganskiella cystojenkinii]